MRKATRNIEAETSKVTTGNGPAQSSFKALNFNLISPHTLRRLAKRKSVGAVKYGTIQWRQGINDAEYVADRYNHLVEHLLSFQESGNEHDDNIAGMLWALDCLSEVERLAPAALKYIVGINDLFGRSATSFHREELKRRADKK